MKYDEKYLYLLVHKDDFEPEHDILYIPFDTTPKTGSTYCQSHDLTFERACDFVLVIDGQEDSRLLVQERYEVLLAMYGTTYYTRDPYLNPPDADTSVFKRIYMPLILSDLLPRSQYGVQIPVGEKYETGVLRYGNGNPQSEDFDSLADFIFARDAVEIRLPWQLLNFSNPSEMMIHDDYYEHYGVENLAVTEMYVGIGDDSNQYRIPMESFALEGWGKQVTSHERLKESYAMLKQYWAQADAARQR